MKSSIVNLSMFFLEKIVTTFFKFWVSQAVRTSVDIGNAVVDHPQHNTKTNFSGCIQVLQLQFQVLLSKTTRGITEMRTWRTENAIYQFK
jgi:hypothetical protein